MSSNHRGSKPLVKRSTVEANRVRQLVADAEAGQLPITRLDLRIGESVVPVVLVTPNQIAISAAYAEASAKYGPDQAPVRYLEMLLPGILYASWDEEAEDGDLLIRGPQDGDLMGKILRSREAVTQLFNETVALLTPKSLGKAGADPNATDPDSSGATSDSGLPNASATPEDPGTTTSPETSDTPTGDGSSSVASASPASEQP